MDEARLVAVFVPWSARPLSDGYEAPRQDRAGPSVTLAGLYTKPDPQPANPNKVMIIVFAIELSAVHEAHRDL